MGNRSRFVVLALLATLALILGGCRQPRDQWTEQEIRTLRSLWIGNLKPLPPDPSNAVADDDRAVALGHALFFDTRFSANGQVACSTCHLPDRQFQDGLPLAQGVGTAGRRTMPIAGIAYSSWFFWDGRKDSLWSQALGPLESSVEHGGDRTMYAHLIARHYAEEYEALFGPLPDLAGLPEHAGPVEEPGAQAAWESMEPEQREAVNRIYSNMGKAIAAYERQLQFAPSRFDRYVKALIEEDQEGMAAALSADEVAGLRLFIGEANCLQCHNGPLFTNNAFHNIGIPDGEGLSQDPGRALGVKQVADDEFNCLGPYSDALPEECTALRFIEEESPFLAGQFKTPTLRNVGERTPYMHAGQFDTLQDVLQHYNEAPAASVGQSELQPLELTERQLAQLEAFLKSLSGPLATPPALLQGP